MRLMDLVMKMDDDEKIAIDSGVDNWIWEGTAEEFQSSYDHESMILKGADVEKIYYSSIYNAIYIKVGGVKWK